MGKKDTMNKSTSIFRLELGGKFIILLHKIEVIRNMRRWRNSIVLGLGSYVLLVTLMGEFKTLHIENKLV